MSPEKTKQLLSKYPEIFGENFHFECNDGWFDIINTLCREIKHHQDKKNKNSTDEDGEENNVKASQVKEKFGGLRFYTYGGDDIVYGLVSFAESLSYKVCENCGNKGNLYQDGWWKTSCEPCQQSWLSKRNGSIT